MKVSRTARALTCLLLLFLALSGLVRMATAGQVGPWKNPANAIVIDAYELNIIDWDAMLKDKHIAAFIAKASDGLPEVFACPGDKASEAYKQCRTVWRKYAVSRELFRTRRLVAKANGLLWGAYHMGRPGNPVDQANHFLDYADPQPDELMVLDIESLDSTQFMSLDDAQVFVGHIKTRTGRYPILYANHKVIEYIANHRDDYPVLARLPLWYARYRPEIVGAFPVGNWDRYFMWQFGSGDNCSERDCPYRVPGAMEDIDVSVAPMTKAELAKIWPQGRLLPAKPEPAPPLVVVASAPICTSLGPDVPITLDPIMTAGNSSAPLPRGDVNELNYQDF
jgi:GH25 family lysozyme M1 (1,4-beta-N-acetylmuramidase)